MSSLFSIIENYLFIYYDMRCHICIYIKLIYPNKKRIVKLKRKKE